MPLRMQHATPTHDQLPHWATPVVHAWSAVQHACVRACVQGTYPTSCRLMAARLQHVERSQRPRLAVRLAGALCSHIEDFAAHFQGRLWPAPPAAGDGSRGSVQGSAACAAPPVQGLELLTYLPGRSLWPGCRDLRSAAAEFSLRLAVRLRVGSMLLCLGG